MNKFLISTASIIIGLGLVTTSASADFTINNTTSTGSQTLTGGQTGTVTSTGTLSVSNNTDITINANGSTASIVNNGLIVNTGTFRDIRDNKGGVALTVTNTGTIESTGNDSFQMNVAGSTVTLTNSGLIEATGTGNNNGQAIDWAALDTNTGTNTLNNTGTITAADSDAVRPGQNGTINNDGLIKSSTSGDSGNDGIDGSNNTNITINNAVANNAANANTIEGARHGITAGDGSDNVTMTVTNNSNGKIIGDNGSGINIDGFANASGVTTETVTITNHGLIQGNGNTILSGETTADGDGVDVDGLVGIINTGTIVSKNAVGTSGNIEKSEGVTVGGGTITNSGLIEGDTINSATQFSIGRGITLAGVDKNSAGTAIPTQSIYANSVINNQANGQIIGGDDAGIAIEGTGTWAPYSVTINNAAGASILGNASSATEGGGTFVAAIEGGATATNATAVTNDMIINNSGVINGNTSGKAIDFGDGTNSLNITGGAAQILGNITGGAGTTTISINTGSGNSFNYSGTISKVQNVSIAAASTFAAGGTQTAGQAANGDTTIDTTGLTSGDTVVTVKNATLNFALGTGGSTSGSKIAITGGVANNFSFDLSSGDSTVAINDLTGGHLVAGQEYVLVQGDDTTFQNLTLGGTSSLGTQIIGGLDLLAANTAGNTFSSEYAGSELYLVGDNIEIDVQAAPEPSAWGLGLLAAGGFALLRLRRRAGANA